MEEASKRLRDAEIRAAEAKVLEEELEERIGELERLRRHLHYGSSSGSETRNCNCSSNFHFR